jgi:hypothetical protein
VDLPASGSWAGGSTAPADEALVDGRVAGESLGVIDDLSPTWTGGSRVLRVKFEAEKCMPP